MQLLAQCAYILLWEIMIVAITCIIFHNASEHPVTLICLTVDMACLNHRKIGILAGR